MITKLEQKILIFGFTIPQGLTLVVISLFYLMLFNLFMALLGFVGAMILGIFVLGLPALGFRTMHALPDRFFEICLHYYLLRPDIYLPGRMDGEQHGSK